MFEGPDKKLIISGVVIFILLTVIMILLVTRPTKDDKEALDCSEPMWNVMVSTQNITRSGIVGNLYPDGAVRIVQADKTTLNIQSRLLPVSGSFALYLQTNGSYPNPDEDYKSMLASMTEGIHDVIELSSERTVSCGAYLHIDRTSAGETSTVPIGFDISKGNVHMSVLKLEEFDKLSHDPQNIYTTLSTSQIQNDIKHIKEQLGTTEAYDLIKKDFFLRFTIIGSTKSYIVTNTDEIDSPIDAVGDVSVHMDGGHLIPHDSNWKNLDSRHRIAGSADVTIWFDGFFKSLKKVAKNTANLATDAVNEIAHTSETIYSGVSDVANAVANAAASQACGSCKTINGVALSILQNNKYQGAAAAAFCLAYAGAIQAAVLPYLPECPMCEGIPISVEAICTAAISKVADKGISLLTKDGRAEASKIMCEYEGMCIDE